MKPVSYNYFRLQKVQSEHILVFDGLAEFSRFVELQQLKTIFLLSNSNGEPEHFLITHKGGLLQQATMGFRKLEDYITAQQKKFPDARTFYQALQEGYTEYEDYRLVQEAGIDDKLLFEKIKTAGFVSGYTEYEEQLKNAEDAPAIGSFTNAHQLYQHALAQGFQNYPEFKNAYTKGFTNADTYSVATSRGFKTMADYADAQQRNILNAEDLAFARLHNLRNDEDAHRFVNLESLNHAGAGHDQRVLLSLLSKLEQGKKISINKLLEKFDTAQNEYRYADNGQMPPWYKTEFKDDAAVTHYLTHNEHVKKYGSYDTDGEFFEINHLKDREVVIDGSNVAHNSHGNDKSKPYYANIIKTVKFLKQKGFTKVSVIVDAALKHRVADAELLSELKNITEFSEAPKETPADIFIIRHVKRNHCLLISNDTFREWKVQDTWVADNIDYYRLTFMIKGNDVLMPDVR